MPQEDKGGSLMGYTHCNNSSNMDNYSPLGQYDYEKPWCIRVFDSENVWRAQKGHWKEKLSAYLFFKNMFSK